MKYGLLGLAALLLSTQAYAENYRIVQSPAQKLDVWIDDVKNNQLSSWCNSTINLRIVTLGELKSEHVDMRTMVIVGSSTTRVVGDWVYTPRWYE